MTYFYRPELVPELDIYGAIRRFCSDAKRDLETRIMFMIGTLWCLVINFEPLDVKIFVVQTCMHERIKVEKTTLVTRMK